MPGPECCEHCCSRNRARCMARRIRRRSTWLPYHRVDVRIDVERSGPGEPFLDRSRHCICPGDRRVKQRATSSCVAQWSCVIQRVKQFRPDLVRAPNTQCACPCCRLRRSLASNLSHATQFGTLVLCRWRSGQIRSKILAKLTLSATGMICGPGRRERRSA